MHMHTHTHTHTHTRTHARAHTHTRLTQVNIIQVPIEVCSVPSLQSRAQSKVTQFNVALEREREYSPSHHHYRTCHTQQVQDITQLEGTFLNCIHIRRKHYNGGTP